MIKTVKMYTVTCDGCGVDANEGEEIVAWTDVVSAVEVAENQGWQTVNSRYYCPKCHENEEEE